MQSDDELESPATPYLDMETLADGPTTTIEGRPAVPTRPQNADHFLASLALEGCLTRSDRRRLATEPSLAAVIGVPSAAWVEPIGKAIEALGQWASIMLRDGSDKSEQRGDRGAGYVAGVLARGGRVVGISHAPDRLLPKTLVNSADVRIVLPQPGPDVLKSAIQAVTGRRPRRMPDHLGSGLDFHDLCAAIRAGTTAGSCVSRLEAASRRYAAPEIGLAAVPALEDLHGYGAAMDWARALVDDVARWRRGEIDFSDIERCVVLASAPGLGKSSFARAVAKALNMPLVATSVGNWFSQSSGYLDGVIKQIDQVLRPPTSPAVVLLDELDAIPDRGSLSDRNREWWVPVVTHLLTTLDGAASADAADLIIIGATNHADRLDPALVRPGRLNRVITIQQPDAAALSGILRQHLGGDLHGEDLLAVAELAVGATGADAAGWIKRARAAARAQQRPMLLDDLVTEIAPQDGRSMEFLRVCAVHEAGHAVAAHVTRCADVRHISIVRGSESGGHTVLAAREAVPSRAFIEAQVRTALAGRAAEIVILGEPSGGAQGDLQKATNLVSALHASLGLDITLAHRAPVEEAHRLLALDRGLLSEVEKDLARLNHETIELVESHRAKIERVAAALIQQRVLGAGEFVSLMVFHDGAASDRILEL